MTDDTVTISNLYYSKLLDLLEAAQNLKDGPKSCYCEREGQMCLPCVKLRSDLIKVVDDIG